MWKAIRDMQRGRRGLIPTRAVTIHDEDDVPCGSISDQHRRWRRHFNKVLNIRSIEDATKVILEAVSGDSDIDDDEEMEPVAAIAAHLADLIYNFNDIHVFSSKSVC